MFVHVLQDVRKAQSLGFALDNGISIVEGDVAKGARWGWHQGWVELARSATSGVSGGV